MNVRCIVLLLVCSSTAADPGLAASSSEGCAPECHGSCFAGNCLFADNDVDDEDAFRSAQPQQATESTPIGFSQTAGSFSADTPAMSRLLQQATQSTPIGFSPTAGSFSADTPGLPSSLTQALRLQATMPAAATTELAFQSEEVPDNKAQELSAINSELQIQRAYSETSSELQRAEAHESLLRVQNEKLRQQLYEWKLAGTSIAQREAKVMSLLGSQSPASAAALPAATPSAVQKIESTVAAVASASAAPVLHPSVFLESARQHLEKTREHLEKTSLGHSFLMIAEGIFVILALLNIGCFFQRYRNGEVNLQCWSKASHALAKNPNNQRLQPVLRAMGLLQYKVEISEIYLGSPFAGSSDVRVNFRLGNGTERRTKVLKNAGGTFLRFDDILELSVSGSDSPCTICVTDRRGDLAHVEIPAAHMVKLASRPNQEYFRTELTASRELGDLNGRRPYVAMRMRNKAGPLPPAAASSKTVGGRGKRSLEERVYGSFAV